MARRDCRARWFAICFFFVATRARSIGRIGQRQLEPESLRTIGDSRRKRCSLKSADTIARFDDKDLCFKYALTLGTETAWRGGIVARVGLRFGALLWPLTRGL